MCGRSLTDSTIKRNVRPLLEKPSNIKITFFVSSNGDLYEIVRTVFARREEVKIT